MPIFADLVLAFAWTFGANGFLIERQLTGVEALPSAWLGPVTEHTRIAFHDREDWAMAFYVSAGHASGATATEDAAPRLALFAPYYLAPGGLVAASGMPVDVAEYYFHALIEAALDLRVSLAPLRGDIERDSAYAGWIGKRAAALMTGTPEAHRRAAYTSALADFGAHLLSMRNEIARLAERQAAAGRDLCRLLDQPASLFGLWRRSLEDGRYPGEYFASEAGSPPRWVTSRQALERSDKDRFLAEVLGVTWTGEPRDDFETICFKTERPGGARVSSPGFQPRE